MQTPYPFTEEPDWRDGHRTFKFEFGKREIILLTIERDGELPKSLVYYAGDIGFHDPLPFSAGIPCILNVEAVVTLLHMFRIMHEKGMDRGTAQAQQAMRHALGIEDA
jgi:hypothetical protein